MKKEEAMEDIKAMQAETERLEKSVIPLVNEFLAVPQEGVATEEYKKIYLNRLLAIARVCIGLQEQMKTILLANNVEEEKMEVLLRAFRQDAREDAKQLEQKVEELRVKAQAEASGPALSG